MFFRDVIDQEVAKWRLIQEVQEGRISHTQLFYGPAGTGKFPFALAYARYICCLNRMEAGACGTCFSCVKWNKLVHPGVHFVFPIVKSVKGKGEVCNDYVADWRHLVLNNPYFSLNHWLNAMGAKSRQAIIYAKESDEITREPSLKSSEGGYKVTIIWLPEKMHEICANKLLKLSGESPEKAVFLLVSEAPEMVLSTILSRTQRFNIRKVEKMSIADALQRKCGIQPIDSQTIARLTNGNFIKALETIHLNKEGELSLNLSISLMCFPYQRKIRGTKQWGEQLAAMGRECQKNFLEYRQRMIRENSIYNLHRKKNEPHDSARAGLRHPLCPVCQ